MRRAPRTAKLTSLRHSASAIALRLGNFSTSMLADLEAGRSLELGPQLGAVVEIAGLLGIPAPFSRSILGLARLISP